MVFFSILVSGFASEVREDNQRSYLVAFEMSALYGDKWFFAPPSSEVAETGSSHVWSTRNVSGSFEESRSAPTSHGRESGSASLTTHGFLDDYGNDSI